MKQIPPSPLVLLNQPRRRFIQGLAVGSVLLGLSPLTKATLSDPPSATDIGSAKILTGTEFDLTIAKTPVNFTGSHHLRAVDGSHGLRARDISTAKRHGGRSPCIG